MNRILAAANIYVVLIKQVTLHTDACLRTCSSGISKMPSEYKLLAQML